MPKKEEKIKYNEFKCDRCGGVFEKGWSDEEALLEAENNFVKPVKEWKDDIVVVCDDCYEKINPSKYPKLVEQAKKFI